MTEFTIALSTVLLTLCYIFPGYVLCKAGKSNPDHMSTLSSILIYGLSPCMIVSSFLKMDFSADNLKWMAIFFVVSFIGQSLFMGLLYLLLHKKYDNAVYRITTIGCVLGNVGFFGMPIVTAMQPGHPEVACYSSIYVVSMNLLVFTMGIYCLTRKKEYMTLKSALLNPSSLAFYVAVPLYLLGANKFLPDLVVNAVSTLGAMTTPLCMIILGTRLATVPVKKLFTNKAVYIITLGKSILFPLFCYGLVYFLPFPETFKASMLIISSTPCASVILNLAEIHHSETELSANCILVTTLLSFITIPLMSLLL